MALQRELKNNDIGHILNRIYEKLLGAFGPQEWWPAESNFEVIVGAILTQNTAWGNVEKAISVLRERELLTPSALHKAPPGILAEAIRSSGCYNLKAARLKAFSEFLADRYGGDIAKMFRRDGESLRHELLSIKGIGEETADAILLYAGGHPTFVVDAYTRRVLIRHLLIPSHAGYGDIRHFFMSALARDEGLYNEYHALLVQVGKRFCRRRLPLCRSCPLM